MSSVLSETPMPFQKITGAYRIGSAIFVASLGLDYLYMLLRHPFRLISCAVLENGNELSDGEAENLKPDPILQESGISLHSEGSTTGYQATLDPQAIKEIRVRIRELGQEESLNSIDQSELNFLKSEIQNNVFQGKSRSLADDGEKCMRRVCKDISRAIAKIIEHPDTEVMLIGIHLKDNVSKGYECRYVGNWPLMSHL